MMNMHSVALPFLCQLCLFASPQVPAATTEQVEDQQTAREERVLDAARSGHLFTLGTLLGEVSASDIPSMKSALEEIDGREDRGSESRSLMRALAKLGDSDAREAIIEEFGSPDLYVRKRAFWDARSLAGEDMVCAVAERLFDPSPGGRPPGSVHEIILPTRQMALLTLVRILDDPTAPPTHRVIGTDEEVEVWKEWWLANKHRYQPERPQTNPE